MATMLATRSGPSLTQLAAAGLVAVLSWRLLIDRPPRRSSRAARRPRRGFIGDLFAPLEFDPPRRADPSRLKRPKKEKADKADGGSVLDRIADGATVDLKDVPGLAEAMRTGGARIKNPALSDEDRAAFDRAVATSTRFHGAAQVVELTPAERVGLPRYVAVVGDLSELGYVAPGSSDRRGVEWVHESGDRGPLAKRSRHRPLLVVDPTNEDRPAIVPNRSPMRLDPTHGLVG